MIQYEPHFTWFLNVPNCTASFSQSPFNSFAYTSHCQPQLRHCAYSVLYEFVKVGNIIQSSFIFKLLLLQNYTLLHYSMCPIIIDIWYSTQNKCSFDLKCSKLHCFIFWVHFIHLSRLPIGSLSLGTELAASLQNIYGISCTFSISENEITNLDLPCN